MGIGVVSTERDVEHASVQAGQQQQPSLPSSAAGLAASHILCCSYCRYLVSVRLQDITRIRQVH